MLLQIKNRSPQYSYRVSGVLNVESILYTGRNRDRVKAVDFDQNIPPESVEMIEMEVTFYDYYKKLMDQASFNISCMAKVHETDYDYYAEDDFRVRKPDVRIKLQGIPEVDQEFDVILRLANPLPISLKNCVFHVQGTSIPRQLQLKVNLIFISQDASKNRLNSMTGVRGASGWSSVCNVQIYAAFCWACHFCCQIFLETTERCRRFHCF